MDECLVHSIFDGDREYTHQLKGGSAGGASGTDDDNTERCASFRLTMMDNEQCIVNLRPGLEGFLAAVCARFDTWVFTAGMELYASPLLDTIDPEGLLKGRLYRNDCRMHKGYFLKDLRVLAPDGDMSNIVLVDNNPVSFLCNPRNGIPVPSWYDDPADRALDDVLELLGELDAADDVRPVLDEKFSLKDLLSTERARILDVVDPDECPN